MNVTSLLFLFSTFHMIVSMSIEVEEEKYLFRLDKNYLSVVMLIDTDKLAKSKRLEVQQSLPIVRQRFCMHQMKAVELTFHSNIRILNSRWCRHPVGSIWFHK